MIKEYTIKKGSIGPIILDMNKEAVRDAMKHESELHLLERGVIPTHFPESDLFFDSSFIVEYNSQGFVETITLMRDGGEVTPILEGKDIFAMVASDVIALCMNIYGEGQKKDFAIESCYSWDDQHITLQVLNDSNVIESITVSRGGKGCIVSPLHTKIV